MAQTIDRSNCFVLEALDRTLWCAIACSRPGTSTRPRFSLDLVREHLPASCRAYVPRPGALAK
jgi:hypothetical protein